MNKLTLAAGAAVLAMTATALLAAPGAMRHGPDADGDGNVTRAEATTAANAMWTKLDVNSDGVLNQADRAARHAAKFDRLDTDKNGSISREEFAAMHARHGKAGGEHSGMAGHEGMAGHDGGDMKGMMGGHRMGGRGGMMAMHMAKMADTNADGSVSRAEFDAATQKHFAMVDTDKNGTISKAEREAAHHTMRATMHPGKPAPAN